MFEKVLRLSEKVKELYDDQKHPVKSYGEFQHQAKSWSWDQRVICKAEHNEKGPNIRFIATNLESNNLRMIYETIYCNRGAMELMIKEHKIHLRSDKTSCTRFWANQFRLFLHSMAYVLLHAFREMCLKNTQFAKAQFDTIRLKILKLGTRVVHLSTKIKIHLSSSCPYQEEIFKAWRYCLD